MTRSSLGPWPRRGLHDGSDGVPWSRRSGVADARAIGPTPDLGPPILARHQPGLSLTGHGPHQRRPHGSGKVRGVLAVRNPMASAWRRWPSIFIVALTLVVACQSSGPTASPSAPATQWQRVLAGIGPNGEVDAATALSAFSVAVGPLPGVNLPTGAPPTPADIIDGAAPLRWLLRVWDQLTLEQQQAATAALDALGTPDFTALTREPTARAEPRIVLAGAPPGSSAADECGIWYYSVTEPPIALPAAVQPYAEDLMGHGPSSPGRQALLDVRSPDGRSVIRRRGQETAEGGDRNGIAVAAWIRLFKPLEIAAVQIDDAMVSLPLVSA